MTPVARPNAGDRMLQPPLWETTLMDLAAGFAQRLPAGDDRVGGVSSCLICGLSIAPSARSRLISGSAICPTPIASSADVMRPRPATSGDRRIPL